MQMALHSAKCDPQQPLSCKHGLHGQAEATKYNFLKLFFPKYNLFCLKFSLLSNAGDLAHLYSLDLTFCLGSSLSNQQASALCLSYQNSGYDFHLDHWLLLGFYMHFNLFLEKLKIMVEWVGDTDCISSTMLGREFMRGVVLNKFRKILLFIDHYLIIFLDF